MNKEQKAVEPEIIEPGQPLKTSSVYDAPRKALVGILGTAASIIGAVMAFILFAFVAVIIAVPLLILSLFGKKPNVKIFKYKI